MDMLTIAASAITSLTLIARTHLWLEPDEEPHLGPHEPHTPDPLHDPLGLGGPLGLPDHAPWDVPIYPDPLGLGLPGNLSAQPPFGPSTYDSLPPPYDTSDGLPAHHESLDSEYGPEPRAYGADSLGDTLEPRDALLDDMGSDQTMLDEVESAVEADYVDDAPNGHGSSVGDDPLGDGGDPDYYDGEPLDRLEAETEGSGEAEEEQYNQSQAAAEWDPEQPAEERPPRARRSLRHGGADAPDPYPEATGRRSPDYSAPPWLPHGRPGQSAGVSPNRSSTFCCSQYGDVTLGDCESCEDYEPVEDGDGNERCQHLVDEDE